MQNINIVVVGGVRPQFIKMAALDYEIRKFNQTSPIQIRPVYVNTHQHYDRQLSSALIEELGLTIDCELEHASHDPVHILGNSIIQLHDYLVPMVANLHWLVVFGDATTAMVGAMVGTRLGLPVLHIEAGVRSGDLKGLEEQHRRIVSHIASMHFCTAKSAVDNLAREGITESVYWTGDLAYDYFCDHLSQADPQLDGLQDYILATIHKSSNFRSPDILRNLVTTLAAYERPVVFVTHPKTRHAIMELGLYNSQGIHFVDALPYTRMLAVLQNCAFLVTDSGGLQREASYLKKHCLVRREAVGWSSLINAGINRLIGVSETEILEGLAWAERNLQNVDAFSHFDEFFKPHAGQDALQTLVERTCLTQP